MTTYTSTYLPGVFSYGHEVLFFAALFAVIGTIFERACSIPLILRLALFPKILGNFGFVFGKRTLALGLVHKPWSLELAVNAGLLSDVS